MEDKKCVILTKKEYDGLLKKVADNKPDTIIVTIGRYGHSLDYSGTIDLSGNIVSKLRQMFNSVTKPYIDSINFKNGRIDELVKVHNEYLMIQSKWWYKLFKRF
jgi:hypothetical protein